MDRRKAFEELKLGFLLMCLPKLASVKRTKGENGSLKTGCSLHKGGNVLVSYTDVSSSDI